MNILQINTLDQKGGAAKIAHSLHTEFHSQHHTAHLLVARRTSIDENCELFPTSRLREALNRRLHLHERWHPTAAFLKAHPWFQSADVIQYHNLHGGYFNILDLPTLAAKKPSVWTLHDPWSIQQAGLTPEYEGLFKPTDQRFQALKYKSIHASPLVFVAPSHWLASKVRHVYPQNVEIIPNGIDTGIFRPQSKILARQALHLPLEKPIILCVAAGGTQNHLKGFSDLERLIQSPIPNDPLFLTIGGDSTSETHPRIRHLPYVSDETKLAEYYAAADIFLFLSRAENFPLVLLEALATGTPVVSYRVGGIPEAVVHEETGYLATPFDIEDVIHGLSVFLNQNAAQKQQISEKARQRAENLYDVKTMTNRYIDLYHSLS